MRQLPLKFNKEIETAIKNKQPIVALESTIISHGMPYPDNIECAQTVENIIRKQGATPATIALHDGHIHIGIDEKLMTHLANSDEVLKASRRDLAFIISQRLTASTTVAATMYCAHLANISIFVTGGIGGVHPKVSEHFDISADIIELATTPVAVVCSGAKSILDLPKTLEMLETHGVPVVGYQTDEFPAFYSHSSGISLVHRLDSVNEIAKMLITQHHLGLTNGIVVANPIPKNAEIPDDKLIPIIEQAHQEAHHINGKSITPFLLKRIAELTEGQSLKANIELIKNNAELGANIATAMKAF
ncbi:pseudouridine-5'-phosphate glycosidase [Legionella sp. W05-934-2]|uniref:pseudouridine-5'-phosphate glycosidase n=1 Tax=Legionella sp. W05-934-2 TaxID=1198649 RepID=UPI00346334E4